MPKRSPAKRSAPKQAQASLRASQRPKPSSGALALSKKGKAAKPARARDAEALRRARLDVSSRRLQLIALGIQAFTEEPYDEVSIDEVARKAGISKGLLYHYFPSKKAFYAATLRAAAAQLLDATATDPSLPPLERLEAGLDAFLLYAEQHGRAYAALLHGGASVDREVFQIIEATRARFQTRLLEGLPSELSGATVRLLSRGWVAMVEAATLEWIERRELGRDELRALLSQTLLAILGAQVVLPTITKRAEASKARAK